MRLFNAMKSFNQVMVSLILLTISTLSWAQKTVITYIHTDHLGTPVMATHEDGSVKWKNDYQPFGEQVKSTPTDSNVGFTGHLKDKGIGLTYMKGRWYQPESGRFMALDPVGYTQKNPVMSFNRYLYVNNNPYKYNDPDGEFLNFAIKFVADVALGAALNYVTTGSLGLASAIKDSAQGVLNPAKSVAKFKKFASAVSRSRAKRRASRAAQRKKDNPRVATSQSGQNTQGNNYGDDNLRGQIKTGMDGKTRVGIQDGSKDISNGPGHEPAIDVGNLKGSGHPDVNKHGQPNISNIGKVKADIE